MKTHKLLKILAISFSLSLATMFIAYRGGFIFSDDPLTLPDSGSTMNTAYNIETMQFDSPITMLPSSKSMSLPKTQVQKKQPRSNAPDSPVVKIDTNTIIFDTLFSSSKSDLILSPQQIKELSKRSNRRGKRFLK